MKGTSNFTNMDFQKLECSFFSQPRYNMEKLFENFVTHKAIFSKCPTNSIFWLVKYTLHWRIKQILMCLCFRSLLTMFVCSKSSLPFIAYVFLSLSFLSLSFQKLEIIMKKTKTSFFFFSALSLIDSELFYNCRSFLTFFKQQQQKENTSVLASFLFSFLSYFNLMQVGLVFITHLFILRHALHLTLV